LLMPLATQALIELTEKQAQDYWNGHLARLRSAGLSVTAEVARGDPAPYLLHAAQRVRADLIVLGTHRKAGLEAFWAGSVGPKLAGHAHAPLLLVPLPDTSKTENVPGSEPT
jgi:nucleotide-binding universal stress UspA family protein